MLHFSSDYHLGCTLNTHTTHTSRAKLKDALYHQALGVTSIKHDEAHYGLGDMVHKYQNNEETIQQVMTILDRLACCITGNHDVSNRTDSIGTMELLENTYNTVPAVMNKCKPVVRITNEAVLTLVPHTNSQELFEKTLTKLAEDTSHKKAELLLLHCNYEIPWEANETTLNLTKKVAKKLLERFDYILIGHEHNYREALDGRVVLLGSVHPTNFGDISDKYRWTFDGTEVKKHLVWEKAKHFKQIKAFEEEVNFDDIQFCEVIGDVPAAEYPNYCRWLAGLWKTYQGYAIRSNVQTTRDEFTDQIDETSLQNLMDTIASELEGDKKLLNIFSKLREEL